MKETFTYPFFFRLIYRYGNIGATLVLLLYMVPMLNFTNAPIGQKIYAGLIVIMIFFLNRYFLRLNQKTPYKIELVDDRLICTDFFLSKKKIVINAAEITDLYGGIFDGRTRGMMRVITSKEEIIFYHSILNADKLEAYLISKAKKELYDKVVANIRNRKK